MKVLVSACLAGHACRFDGTSCPDADVMEMTRSGAAVPGCPEVLGGLGVPRPPAEIVGGDGHAVLTGSARVMTGAGEDLTEAFLAGAKAFVELGQDAGCGRAVLKSGSPACGVGVVFDGTFSGTVQSGDGVAAAALKAAGMEVLSID